MAFVQESHSQENRRILTTTKEIDNFHSIKIKTSLYYKAPLTETGVKLEWEEMFAIGDVLGKNKPKPKAKSPHTSKKVI